MIDKHVFYWLWVGFIVYFVVVEGIAIYYEIKLKIGDGDTLTHFLVTNIPLGIRFALIGWLIYHFLIVHKYF